MPHAPTKILPPDFDTFMLPPAVLANVNRPFAMQSLDLGLSGQAWARQELDAQASNPSAQAAGQPGEPGRAGPWSPTDHLLADMEDLDLGISGHAWARQELDSSAPSHMAQATWQPDPAGQPYYLIRLQLLQQALGRQEAPSAMRPASDAAAAEEEPDIAAVLEFGDVDAQEVPAVPPMADVLDALDAPNPPQAPMAPDAPITLEAVFLEEAAEPAFVPMAGILDAMALAGLIGLNPEQHFSGM